MDNSTIRPTRFKELGYRQDDTNLWRIYDLQGDRPAAVGAYYKTKAELLANLERYASFYGCESAVPLEMAPRPSQSQADFNYADKAARAILKKLHHYVQPNPVIPTPYYEQDVRIVGLALLDAVKYGVTTLHRDIVDAIAEERKA